MSIKLERPDCIGEVPYELLTSLYKLPKGRDGVLGTREKSVRAYKHLYPVVEAIAEMAGRTTTRAFTLVDKARIEPGAPHMLESSIWHRDDTEAFIVSTTNPTEYLEGQVAPGARPWWDSLEQPGSDSYDELADSFSFASEEADQFGLEIWRPNPGEVVHQTFQNIHKGPLNNTGNRLDRVFVAVTFLE